ncbi:MAG TPA: hypothetical protein VI072_04215 [Polyangiaceae bacterium]
MATSLAVACSSDSASRADDDDDGGAGGTAGSGGRGDGGGGANSCGECIDEECAAEFGRCDGNQACQQIVACYDACEDAECAAACDVEYPAGVTDWYALVTCSAQNCADPCEFEGTGGTGGTGGIGASCVPPTDNGTCDNFPRVCGCTATENCIFDVDTKDTVCAAPGSTLAHARCTSETCAKGHGCVGGSASLSGTCRPYCDTKSDCRSTPFNRCIQVTREVDDVNVPVEGFKVCTQHCNLSDPANTARNAAFGACGTGANCVLDNFDEGTTLCYGNSGPPKTTCTDSGDCANGYGCSAADTCQKWCRVGFNADCAVTPATPVCGRFTPGLFVPSGADGGRTEYGFCVARATDGGVGSLPDAGPPSP